MINVNSPNRHHAEGNVLGGHVVSTLDFVDLVCFRHDYAVMLKNHCVRVYSGLGTEKTKLYDFCCRESSKREGVLFAIEVYVSFSLGYRTNRLRH